MALWDHVVSMALASMAALMKLQFADFDSATTEICGEQEEIGELARVTAKGPETCICR
eukprot:CAMPEP_0183345164 /NCGR_PEP_ID=MMETSP0164_2-20130417/10671_1 /TAXON_ID=221442 /ORGANISM="Coccolithus pelagicus ssp braarudi, Strain PLY182g" /LENGTH=57 /DNA_ID=CAMNT_0025516275 /DNA_START=325 /DNA_END=495 /DNA_ORIENTATION=-